MNQRQKQIRERYVEDNLYEQHYLSLQTDFAKGYKKGKHEEKMRIIRLIKKYAGTQNAMHKILHKLIEENEEEILKCMKKMNQKYTTVQ